MNLFKRFSYSAIANKVKVFLMLLGVFCVMLAGTQAFADTDTVAKTINYQGKLSDALGETVPTDDYDMQFAIYDGSGTCVWVAKGSCGATQSVSVTVTNGLFSVLLGSDLEQSANALTADVFNGSERYLGVKIGADLEMSPRKQLGASPFAINSALLNGLEARTTGATSSYIVATDVSGNVYLTGNPTGANGVLTINPSSSDVGVNDYLILAEVSDATKFSVGGDGSLNAAGNATVSGSVNLSNMLYSTATGVGIGMTNPEATLEVHFVSSASAEMAGVTAVDGDVNHSIESMIGLLFGGFSIDGADTVVTNSYGIKVNANNVGSGSLINAYGMYIEDQDSATGNNYGLYIEGASTYSMYVASGSSYFAGNILMAPTGTATGNTGEVRFNELAANGSNYIGIKSPDALAASLSLILPESLGEVGQSLMVSATTADSVSLAWGSGMPTGETPNATLRWSGSAWVENDKLLATADGQLQFMEFANGADNYVSLESPNSMAGNTSLRLVLPSASGSVGYALKITSTSAGVAELGWGDTVTALSLQLAYDGGNQIVTGGSADIVYDLVGTDEFIIKNDNATFATFTENGHVVFNNNFTADGLAVFNELGAVNSDFRVESDANDHMLFVDSSANQVGIGASALQASSSLTVHGSLALMPVSGEPSSLYLGDNDGANFYQIRVPNLTSDVEFVLPANYGEADYSLITDGAGHLNWALVSGSGSVVASDGLWVTTLLGDIKPATAGLDINLLGGSSLVVAGAGTIQLDSLTHRGVLFSEDVGGYGEIRDDSTNFYWDNTNKQLGIGTNSPQATLHVRLVSAADGSSATANYTAGSINNNIADVYGYKFGGNTVDDGVSVSRSYGMWIGDNTVTSGAINNVYGLYIQNQDSATEIVSGVATGDFTSTACSDVATLLVSLEIPISWTTEKFTSCVCTGEGCDEPSDFSGTVDTCSDVVDDLDEICGGLEMLFPGAYCNGDGVGSCSCTYNCAAGPVADFTITSCIEAVAIATASPPVGFSYDGSLQDGCGGSAEPSLFSDTAACNWNGEPQCVGDVTVCSDFATESMCVLWADSGCGWADGACSCSGETCGTFGAAEGEGTSEVAGNNYGIYVEGASTYAMYVASGSSYFSGNILMAPTGTATGNTGEVRFNELAANGTNYIGFKAPDALAASLSLVLPTTSGSVGQALKITATSSDTVTLAWGDVTVASGLPEGLVANSTMRFDGADWLENSNFRTEVDSNYSIMHLGPDTSDAVANTDEFSFRYDTTSKSLGLRYATSSVDMMTFDSEGSVSIGDPLSEFWEAAAQVYSPKVIVNRSLPNGLLYDTFEEALMRSSVGMGQLTVVENETPTYFLSNLMGGVFMAQFNLSTDSVLITHNPGATGVVGAGVVGGDGGDVDEGITVTGVHGMSGNSPGVATITTGTISYMAGVQGTVEVHTSSLNVEEAIGLDGSVSLRNSADFHGLTIATTSGQITTAMGVRAAVSLGLGQITDAYGVFVSTPETCNTSNDAVCSENLGSVINGYGVYVGGQRGTAGVYETVTNSYSVYLSAGGNDGMATSDYGLYIEGANDYSIYSASGTNYFGEQMLLGSTTASDGFLSITSPTSHSLRINPYGPDMGNTGNLEFMEHAAFGANFVALRSPDMLAANVTLTLPTTDGDNGQVLKTDGSGNLSWVPGLPSSGTEGYTMRYDAAGAIWQATNALVVSASGNVGIGNTNPEALLTVGANGEFTVDSSGDLTKINNVAYSFPSSSGSQYQVLMLTGGGTLDWQTVSTAALAVGTTNNATLRWDSASSSWVQNSGFLTGVDGNATISGNLSVDAVTPFFNNLFDLGSDSLRWRDLYLAEDSLHIGTDLTDEYKIGYNTASNSLDFNQPTNSGVEFSLWSDGGIMAAGTPTVALTVSGAGTRMFWYPYKAAFRAGSIDGDQWDNSNVGLNSVAMGYNNKAKGASSGVLSGNTNSVLDPRSVIAGGYDNTIDSGLYFDGFSGIVSGQGNLVSSLYYGFIGTGEDNVVAGDNSAILSGWLNIASGTYAVILGGDNNLASGAYSVVLGGNANEATGEYSSVLNGNTNEAQGQYATVLGGLNNQANGDYALAFGRNMQLSAAADRTMVFGYDSSPFSVTQADAFIIKAANGVAINKNAVASGYALDVNGNALINGNIIPSVSASLNLGSDSLRWQDLFLANNSLHIGSSISDEFEISYDTASNSLLFTHPTFTGDQVMNFTSDGGFISRNAGGYNSSYGTITSGRTMIWSPSNGALRAGALDGDGTGFWDYSNVGDYSVAFGLNTSASADNSGVLGGELNRASAIYSSIVGGLSNTNAGDYGFIGSGESNSIDSASDYASIVGGEDNSITEAIYSFLGGGQQNIATGTAAVLVGGNRNALSGDYAVLGGGTSNLLDGFGAALVGGWDNAVIGAESFVGGGYGNIVTGSVSVVAGGDSNNILGNDGFIGGGEDNNLVGNHLVVTGGKLNTLTAGNYSAIVGGYSNTASGSYNFIGGGDDNEITTTNYSDINNVLVGGDSNTINLSLDSGILGGALNQIYGADNAAILGGVNNLVSGGNYSAILGGASNSTLGDYSVVAGSNMTLSATADRTFVYGYSSLTQTISAADSFIVYHDGGSHIGLNTISPNTAYTLSITGDTLSAGDIIPSGSYDLGSTTNRWEDVYVANSLHIGEDSSNEYVLGYNTTYSSFEVKNGTTVGATFAIRSANTTVQDTDYLGTILFQGSDSQSPRLTGAVIRAIADGNWDNEADFDQPGKLSFYTQVGGTEESSLTAPRMVIDHDGMVRIGVDSDATTAALDGEAGELFVSDEMQVGSNAYIGGILKVDASPYATTSYVGGSGDLYVRDTIEGGGALYIGGAGAFSGRVRIDDATLGTINYATAAGDLYVEDSIETDGSLYVGGVGTIGSGTGNDYSNESGDLYVEKSIEADGNLYLKGLSYLWGLVRVDDDTAGTANYATASGSLYVNNNVEADGTLYVGGVVTASSGVRILGGNDLQLYKAGNATAWNLYTDSSNDLNFSYDGSIDNPKFKFSASGVGYADVSWESPALDFAEYMEKASNEIVEVAEIVAVNETGKIVRGSTYSTQLVGVITTKPGFVGGRGAIPLGKEADFVQVAMVGQVPTFVKGDIQPGDKITISDVPGVGRRAEADESNVGIALEAHTGDTIDKITVLITRNNSAVPDFLKKPLFKNKVEISAAGNEGPMFVLSSDANGNGDLLSMDYASSSLVLSMKAGSEIKLGNALSIKEENGKGKIEGDWGVNGQVSATQGLVTYTKEGPISDGDFVTVANGLIGIDTTAGAEKLYFRTGDNNWEYVSTSAASFFIPQAERQDPSGNVLNVDSFVVGMVDREVAQTGELHAIYVDFKTALNKEIPQVLASYGIADKQALINTWILDDKDNLVVNDKAIGTIFLTSNGKRTMYVLEGGEAELMISGSSHLVDGKQSILFGEVDPTFTELISHKVPFKVILTPTGGSNGLYIEEKMNNIEDLQVELATTSLSTEFADQIKYTGFKVAELNDGTSGTTFDWMVIARRVDYETADELAAWDTALSSGSFEELGKLMGSVNQGEQVDQVEQVDPEPAPAPSEPEPVVAPEAEPVVVPDAEAPAEEPVVEPVAEPLVEPAPVEAPVPEPATEAPVAPAE